MDLTKKVSEVMSTVLWTLTPDTGIASALRLAQSENVRHFLILDDGSLVGAVSASTLAKASPKGFVGEVMRTPVLCISPGDTVADALQIMEENQVSFLPIVGEGAVVGNVTDEICRGVTRPAPPADRPRRTPEA